MPAPVAFPLGVAEVTPTSVTLLASVIPFTTNSKYIIDLYAGGAQLVSASSGTLASSAATTLSWQVTSLSSSAYTFTVTSSGSTGVTTSTPYAFTTQTPETTLSAVVEQASASNDVTTPHFAWPFTVTSTGVAVNDQDSAEDIFSCVLAIANCTIGAFDIQPSLGVPDETFSTAPPDMSTYIATIMRWEPRATLTDVVTMLDDSGGTWGVNIDVED